MFLPLKLGIASFVKGAANAADEMLDWKAKSDDQKAKDAREAAAAKMKLSNARIEHLWKMRTQSEHEYNQSQKKQQYNIGPFGFMSEDKRNSKGWTNIALNTFNASFDAKGGNDRVNGWYESLSEPQQQSFGAHLAKLLNMWRQGTAQKLQTGTRLKNDKVIGGAQQLVYADPQIAFANTFRWFQNKFPKQASSLLKAMGQQDQAGKTTRPPVDAANDPETKIIAGLPKVDKNNPNGQFVKRALGSIATNRSFYNAGLPGVPNPKKPISHFDNNWINWGARTITLINPQTSAPQRVSYARILDGTKTSLGKSRMADTIVSRYYFKISEPGLELESPNADGSIPSQATWGSEAREITEGIRNFYIPADFRRSVVIQTAQVNAVNNASYGKGSVTNRTSGSIEEFNKEFKSKTSVTKKDFENYRNRYDASIKVMGYLGQMRRIIRSGDADLSWWGNTKSAIASTLGVFDNILSDLDRWTSDENGDSKSTYMTLRDNAARHLDDYRTGSYTDKIAQKSAVLKSVAALAAFAMAQITQNNTDKISNKDIEIMQEKVLSMTGPREAQIAVINSLMRDMAVIRLAHAGYSDHSSTDSAARTYHNFGAANWQRNLILNSDKGTILKLLNSPEVRDEWIRKRNKRIGLPGVNSASSQTTIGFQELDEHLRKGVPENNVNVISTYSGRQFGEAKTIRGKILRELHVGHTTYIEGMAEEGVVVGARPATYMFDTQLTEDKDAFTNTLKAASWNLVNTINPDRSSTVSVYNISGLGHIAIAATEGEGKGRTLTVFTSEVGQILFINRDDIEQAISTSGTGAKQTRRPVPNGGANIKKLVPPNKNLTKGTTTYAGGKYVGELSNGIMHGQGTWTHPKGNKFVGEFRDGKPHGQGTATWADGNRYVGEFRDGTMHGQGTKTYADGRVEEGIWKNGEFQSAGSDTPPQSSRARPPSTTFAIKPLRPEASAPAPEPAVSAPASSASVPTPSREASTVRRSERQIRAINAEIENFKNQLTAQTDKNSPESMRLKKNITERQKILDQNKRAGN